MSMKIVYKVVEKNKQDKRVGVSIRNVSNVSSLREEL